MDFSNFILPVKEITHEGMCFKGNGFFIDDFFVTDGHVAEPDAAAIGDTFIEWKGNPIYLNEKNKVFSINNIIEYKDETYLATDASDIAVFRVTGVKSPFSLSKSFPREGQLLYNFFFREKKTNSLNTCKKTLFWRTVGSVKLIPDYPNFFLADMIPSHPGPGGCGSPIFDKNYVVYGLVQCGDKNICGFYSASHALQLLHKNI